MPDEKEHNLDDVGELRFDFSKSRNADDDLKFVISVKNLLVIIKDFYGADSTAVFWFNKTKNSFKLLTSSEDEQWSNYTERFEADGDALSGACKDKSSGLYDDIEKSGYAEFPFFKNASKVKSVLINPVEINKEVIACIICESKVEKYFGNPNLYSLEVFTNNIESLISYYSLKEEYIYQAGLVRKLRKSVNVYDEEIEGLYSKSFFDRRIDSEISRCKQFNTNELVLVYASIDNIDALKESGISLKEYVKLFFGEIRLLLNGYDMMFRLSENLVAMLIQTEKTDNVLIELEKIRKLISTKIFKLEDKELSFTASFAFKKYENPGMNRDDFLKEINDMLGSAASEGGNVIKY
jgi:GGDEF domain-containing protein